VRSESRGLTRIDSMLAVFFAPKKVAPRVFIRNTVIEGLFPADRTLEEFRLTSYQFVQR